MSDLYGLSIELSAGSHRLEHKYLTEAEARLEAEQLYSRHDLVSVGLFLYRYAHQHDPKLIDCYDGEWASERAADAFDDEYQRHIINSDMER
jgi:hypothetical protein